MEGMKKFLANNPDVKKFLDNNPDVKRNVEIIDTNSREIVEGVKRLEALIQKDSKTTK